MRRMIAKKKIYELLPKRKIVMSIFSFLNRVISLGPYTG